MLDALVPRTDELLFPVRIRLLERQVEGERWWATVTVSGGFQGEDRKASFYTGAAMELKGLDPADQKALLRAFLKGIDPNRRELPADDDDSFWKVLGEPSDAGRPLFVGLVAAGLACGDVEGLRQANRSMLMATVYEHEMAAWQRMCPDDGVRKAAANLVAIATACRGLDPEGLEDRHFRELEKAGALSPAVSPEEVWEGAFRLTGGNPRYALEPDLLGEFCLTKLWPRPRHPAASKAPQAKIDAAWDLDKDATVVSLAHAMDDFPESDAPIGWVQALIARDWTSARDRWLLSAILVQYLQASGEQHLEMLPQLAQTCRSLEAQEDEDIFTGAGEVLSRALSLLVGIFADRQDWDQAVETFRVVTEYADKKNYWRVHFDVASAGATLFYGAAEADRKAVAVTAFQVAMNLMKAPENRGAPSPI
jgi:hypothetical protein